MRTGFDMGTGADRIPLALVQVWCCRCQRPAGLWCADAHGAGAWRHEYHKRCRCDPLPTVPEGTELDELVAQARRSRNKGRPRPLNVSR